MNGVKGLVLKELYLRRKVLIIECITLFLLLILAVSFCLSFDYGNLKNRDDISSDYVVNFAYFIAASMMLTLTSNGDTIGKDANCRWSVFECTLPISPKRLAAIRLGIVLGTDLAAFGLSVLTTWWIFTLAHRTLTLAVFQNLCVIGISSLLIMVVMNALNLRFKNPKTASGYLFGGLVAIGVAVSFWANGKLGELREQFSDIAEDELDQILAAKLLEPLCELRGKLFPYFIPIYVIIAAAGYFLFLAQIKRREK